MTRKSKFLLTFTMSLLAMGLSAVAFAQGDAAALDPEAATAVAKFDAAAWVAIASAVAIALAAFGGALGQARAAATALEGIARNPGAADKLFTPMILGLALIESLVIYALIIAFLLVGKVPSL
ncbi:MAG: F0F1 ATP synthase subunit C [Deltaproteobacteria bacterium]|nr:MAG: F0F1 ATP synthase subunit C [Deltaproteobacteria bacterium]